MRNSILAGIAIVALALGLGAIVTASFESPRASYGLNVVDEGRASSESGLPFAQDVSDTAVR
ncbi:hypothetical protein GCM10007276_22580 [Agaricicola taiwanensis]|uniref:Uncharacterized protein n=1 Tax=Agaricicola taiwanensis TaxID=591372 RepID=A0A8J2YIQ1_9RHOB|nr:hypothetical protein [Agaricicola taiwanensis]GGE44923.1 hypothetical protein GCM10007276_22580 [Agaricicola taiwanensis]